MNHHPTCTPYYPEKPNSEPPQHIQSINLPDGTTALQCSDCGAYEVVSPHPLLSPPSVLQEVARCLYGPHYLTPLSLSLYCPSNHPHPGVNYDNLRMWVKGTRPIPSWVWGELHRLIQERKEEMRRAEGEVEKLRLTLPIDSEKV